MELEELRMQVNAHAIHQQYMQATVEKMNGDVREIKRVVFQVKWALFGCAIALIAAQFGVVQAIKAMI
jgi:hypothetical protein